MKLAQACFELEEQVKLEDLIKTPDCMDVYIHIKEIMANYLQSDYALAKLQSMIPLPSKQDFFNSPAPGLFSTDFGFL